MFQRLLALCSLQDPDYVKYCEDAYNNPQGTIFGVPTLTLTQASKHLKSELPRERYKEFDEVFMSIVTSVSAV